MLPISGTPTRTKYPRTQTVAIYCFLNRLKSETTRQRHEVGRIDLPLDLLQTMQVLAVQLLAAQPGDGVVGVPGIGGRGDPLGLCDGLQPGHGRLHGVVPELVVAGVVPAEVEIERQRRAFVVREGRVGRVLAVGAKGLDVVADGCGAVEVA